MKNRFLTAWDYAVLYERASLILDRELSKPSKEWDEDLIYELEETMLYCAERKKALLQERAMKKKPAKPNRVFPRTMISAIIHKNSNQVRTTDEAD